MSDELKIKALKSYIRRRLIAVGKNPHKYLVDDVFNRVTDNGRDLSEVEIVTDPEKVKQLNGILFGLSKTPTKDS